MGRDQAELRFEMLVTASLWGCQWLLGLVECHWLRCWMPMKIGLWVWMNTGLGIHWYMSWIVLNVERRENAKGCWALLMVLNIGFRRMPWILDFGWKQPLFYWRIWRPRQTSMMHEWYVMICHNGWVWCESGASMIDGKMHGYDLPWWLQ
jgi:hypothetical protein